ncbi:pre-mRNA-splicing factor cwc22 [Coemansia sp. RSA 2706]|nr:pre-mRNA-splicing factor cwc22 [Coemansia sp. RSA 2706]
MESPVTERPESDQRSSVKRSERGDEADSNSDGGMPSPSPRTPLGRESPEHDLPRHGPVAAKRRLPAASQITGRRGVAGGRYMPPALRRQLMAEATDRSDADDTRQRESWDQLKKRINGPVNKANTDNLQDIIVELFGANLVRGRGLFCRSLMHAQAQSTSFTAVYAALVAVINTKLPIIGELLVTRLVLQFRRAFRRDDKNQCLSSVMFLAHLSNQRVAHEVLAFQIVSLLLETPTDDSVEVAVAFAREVGAFLGTIAPRVLSYVFDAFRSILHDAEIDKRTQYMIEVLFQHRRDGFKDNPIIPEGLDLVEEDEQIVHEVAMDDDDLDAQDELNVFKLDPEFEENEEKYAAIRRGILGEGESDDDSGSESGTETSTEGDSESGEESGSDEAEPVEPAQPVKQQIHDLTETEMINLRRTIYLAIMSSLSFEEAAHKLLKIEMRPGEEQELCTMVIECCSQERTYKNFYGLIGERLCKLNRMWAGGFAQAFASCYENIHRYETSHLRNIAHFFAHLLAANALRWSELRVVVLTEETTTSSSRIFLKILLQDLAENLGLQALNQKLKSDDAQISEALRGMFPRDDAKSIRFAINYYTSIGLGAITEEMREWLKAAPTPAAGSDSDSDGSDSGSGSVGSSSGSDSRSSYSSYSSSDSRSDSRSDSGSDSEPDSGARPRVRSRSRVRVRSPSYSPIGRSPRSPSPVRVPKGSRRSPSPSVRHQQSRSPPEKHESEHAAKRMQELALDRRSDHRDESRQQHTKEEPRPAQPVFCAVKIAQVAKSRSTQILSFFIS